MIGFYRDIWDRIRATYYTGYMRVEHGLQAALYAEFQRTFPCVNVVVEPSWPVDGGRVHPDLVIVEGGAITDIFELKFLPWGYPESQEDIERLLGYLAHQERPTRVSAYHHPDTYADENLPLHQDVRLHFVAVGGDAVAVDPQSFAQQAGAVLQNNVLFHWYGRIGGNREWSVQELQAE